jgi:hypothetical protein
VSQAFAVFLPVRSVAVMSVGRRYDYVIVLRAVETVDFMTAGWARLPYEFLDLCARRTAACAQPSLRIWIAPLAHSRNWRRLPPGRRHGRQRCCDATEEEGVGNQVRFKALSAPRRWSTSIRHRRAAGRPASRGENA